MLHFLLLLRQRNEQLGEDGMENAPTDRIEEQVRSAFPEGAIERVQVLTYGEDPAVEPGETAVRVFISRAGRPEGEEADKQIVKATPSARGPHPRKPGLHPAPGSGARDQRTQGQVLKRPGISRLHSTSFVRRCPRADGVAHLGIWASPVTRSIGECRMSWWSILMVSLPSDPAARTAA